MTMVEIYEKYWTVNGQPVPPLPPEEKAIWNAAETLKEPPYVRSWSRRHGGWKYTVNPKVQEFLKSKTD